MNVSCQKVDYEASKVIVVGLNALTSESGCARVWVPVSTFTVEKPSGLQALPLKCDFRLFSQQNGRLCNLTENNTIYHPITTLVQSFAKRRFTRNGKS